MSDWTRKLTGAQVGYAATDAYASLMLFYELEARRLGMREVPGRGEFDVGGRRWEEGEVGIEDEGEWATEEEEESDRVVAGGEKATKNGSTRASRLAAIRAALLSQNAKQPDVFSRRGFGRPA